MQKKKFSRKTIHNIIQAFKYVFSENNFGNYNNWNRNLF